jgi:nucleotide-binding universal stress UspA family protein
MAASGEHAVGQQSERAVPGAEAAGPVLVPIDGSPAMAATLSAARVMATVWQAPLHLLHVTNEPVSTQQLLTALGIDRLDPAALVLDRSTGEPVEAILRSARERRSPLVVMGTHGWTADPTMLLGHVAEGVLRAARVPLLLVNSASAERLPVEVPPLLHILLPLDGTRFAAEPLGPIVRPLAQGGATFDVLHVVSEKPGTAQESDIFTVPRYMDQPYHEWQEWRREFGSRFLHPHAIEARGIHVYVGEAGESIVRAARDLDSHLIVLAWKGAHDADRARTLRAVLRAAPCPVLVVRTAGSEPA